MQHDPFLNPNICPILYRNNEIKIARKAMLFNLSKKPNFPNSQKLEFLKIQKCTTTKTIFTLRVVRPMTNLFSVESFFILWIHFLKYTYLRDISVQRSLKFLQLLSDGLYYKVVHEHKSKTIHITIPYLAKYCS